MKVKMNVFKLYNKLNVNELEDIIKIYKDERLKYDGLFLLYSHLNKVIADKNTYYTNLLIDKANLLDIIKSKKKIEEISGTTNLETYHSKEASKDLNMTKQRVRSTFDFMTMYETKLKKIFLFLGSYDKKLDLIKRYLNPYLTVNEKVEYDEYLELKDIHLWNIHDLKNIVTFLIGFKFKLYYVYNSLLLKTFQTIEKTDKNNQDILIVDIFDKALNQKKGDFLKKITLTSPLKQTGKKIAKISNSISDLNYNSENENTKNKKPDKIFINPSIDSLYDNFFKFVKQENNPKTLEFLENIKHTAKKKLGKFTNELVAENENNLNDNQIRRTSDSNLENRKRMNKTYNKDNKNIANTLPILQQKIHALRKLNTNNISGEDEIDNSYESLKVENTEEGELGNNKRERLLMALKENGEATEFFKRNSDIHKLNVKYFKEKQTKNDLIQQNVKDFFVNMKDDAYLSIINNKNRNFLKKVKYKKKSFRLSKFITDYSKGNYSNFKRNGMDLNSSSMNTWGGENANNRKVSMAASSICNTVYTSVNKDIKVQNNITKANEMMKTTNARTTVERFSTYGNNTNLNTVANQNNNRPFHKKAFSTFTTFADQLKEQLPEIIKTIRNNQAQTLNTQM